MNSNEIDEVATWLRQAKKIVAPSDWLEQCVSYVKHECSQKGLTNYNLRGLVLSQWLNCDLRELEYPILPADFVTAYNRQVDLLQRHKGSSKYRSKAQPVAISEQLLQPIFLEGEYVLQVNTCFDAARSAYSQLRKLTNDTNLVSSYFDELESAATETKPGAPNGKQAGGDSGQKRRFGAGAGAGNTESDGDAQMQTEWRFNEFARGHRELILQLTDGVNVLKATERTRWPFSEAPRCGSKVLLRGKIESRAGMLLVQATQISLLGGVVRSLAGAIQQRSLLEDRLNIQKTVNNGAPIVDANRNLQVTSSSNWPSSSGYSSLQSSATSTTTNRSVANKPTSQKDDKAQVSTSTKGNVSVSKNCSDRPMQQAPLRRVEMDDEFHGAFPDDDFEMFDDFDTPMECGPSTTTLTSTNLKLKADTKSTSLAKQSDTSSSVRETKVPVSSVSKSHDKKANRPIVINDFDDDDFPEVIEVLSASNSNLEPPISSDHKDEYEYIVDEPTNKSAPANPVLLISRPLDEPNVDKSGLPNLSFELSSSNGTKPASQLCVKESPKKVRSLDDSKSTPTVVRLDEVIAFMRTNGYPMYTEEQVVSSANGRSSSNGISSASSATVDQKTTSRFLVRSRVRNLAGKLGFRTGRWKLIVALFDCDCNAVNVESCHCSQLQNTSLVVAFADTTLSQLFEMSAQALAERLRVEPAYATSAEMRSQLTNWAKRFMELHCDYAIVIEFGAIDSSVYQLAEGADSQLFRNGPIITQLVPLAQLR